ncbi:MAG: hypothetical protein IJS47_03565 [Clostridia bacterium]|nr:hypothetical protein [Clostridia bacterium]
MINKLFIYFMLFAIAVLLGFMVLSIAKRYIGKAKNQKTVGKIFGSSIKAILVMCIIPVCSIIIINAVSLVLREAISLTLGNNETNYSVGTLLYLNFTLGLEKDESFSNASFSDDLRKDYLVGNKNYAIDGKNDFYEDRIDYIIAVSVSLITLVIMLICAITFCVKIFELLILYIIAPFFVTSILSDDGDKFYRWCKIFVEKLITGFSLAFLLKIFFVIVPQVFMNDIVFSENATTNLLVRSTFIVGGLYAVYEFSKLIMETLENKDDKRFIKDTLNFGKKTDDLQKRLMLEDNFKKV